VFQEIYEALLYITTPFILICSLYRQLDSDSGIHGNRACNVPCQYNHLQSHSSQAEKGHGAWWPVFSLTLYKLILSFFNAVSVYWTIYEYPSYFANKHFGIIDDPRALEVIPPAKESNLGGVATSEKALHLFTPPRADGN